MQTKFIEPALIELDDAFEYYNLQASGLGKKLIEEVLETIEIISKYPQSYPKNTENTRKAVLRKFPYTLIYSLFKDKVYIIALAHQN